MPVETLKERTLIALRLVQDAMAGHAINEVWPKDLIHTLQRSKDEKTRKDEKRPNC